MTDQTIIEGERILCYVCKKPIHIFEMGGLKNDGKGKELWFHVECYNSIQQERSSTLTEVEGEVEKLFDQYRSSNVRDKKGKRIFGVGDFPVSVRKMRKDFLAVLTRIKQMKEKYG